MDTGKMTLYDLRVNARKEFLGVDALAVYFSWKLLSERENVKQVSYEISVFSDEKGEHLLWSSGRVMTDESAYAPYLGEKLGSETRYYWQVFVVDSCGDSCMSERTWFETGLMGTDQTVWENAKFIGSPKDTVNTDSLRTYCMEMEFLWSCGKTLAFCVAVRDKDNYIAVELQRETVTGEATLHIREYSDGAWQDAVSTVRTYGQEQGYPAAILNGKNEIRLEVDGRQLRVLLNRSCVAQGELLPENEGFLPRRAGLGNHGIRVWDGKVEISEFRISYEKSQFADAVTMHLERSDAYREEPVQDGWVVLCEEKNLVLEKEFYVGNAVPAVAVRKGFTLAARPVCARLYATALGFYDVYVNGKKVNRDFYNPGFTDYRKRVMYQTYDVTDFLECGENRVGAVITKGYYSGYVGYTSAPMVYGRKNLFLGKLVLTYANGERRVIVTDGSWDFLKQCPILNSDYQQGEQYDARIELDWNETEKALAVGVHEWPEQVLPTNGAFSQKEKFIISAQEGQGAEIERILTPVTSCTEARKGHFVYDFGQNMVGTVRLKFCSRQDRGVGRGFSVKIRYGEMCYPDGRLYIANMRSAGNTDCYTAGGDAGELFVPTGTSHGFRYVEISGNGFLMTREMLEAFVVSIEGLVLTNTTEITGEFTCSNEDVNRLQKNIQWGQRGNSLLVYTDCPQRNERMGWTGDAQVFAATAAYNMDVRAFMNKWLTDVRDAQLLYNREGAIPDTAPLGGDNRRMGGCAGWGDAGVIVPWELYKAYGDIEILKTNYDMMKAWVEYQSREDRQFYGLRTVRGVPMEHESDLSQERYLQVQQSRGDHLAFDETTPFIYSATAYAAYVAGLLSGIAGILGKEEDQKKYAERFQKIKKAFCEAWISEKSGIAYWGEMSRENRDIYGNVINRTRYTFGKDKTKRPSQTAYALAIDFDLVPEDKKDIVYEGFRQAILDRDGKLSVGFLGISHLAPALCKAGLSDMAFSLLEETGFPGWLYSVKNGATTIWERWNSYVAESGTFGDVSMNSFNHYAYGAIGEWMFGYIAGIRPGAGKTDAGYRHFYLAPHVGGSLQHASARYESNYGRIESSWERKGNEVHYRFTVPANTTAEICLDGQKREVVGSGCHIRTALRNEKKS